MTVFANGIFDDPAALDEAGVPYPQPGWTWDDFQKAVVALADPSGSQVKFGYYDNPNLSGSILAPVDNHHLVSGGEEVVGATLLKEVQWYVDLSRAGMLSAIKADIDMNDEWQERMKLFKDDATRPGMWLDPMFSFEPSDESTHDPDNLFSGMAIDRYGIAPFPVFMDGPLTQSSRS